MSATTTKTLTWNYPGYVTCMADITKGRFDRVVVYKEGKIRFLVYDDVAILRDIHQALGELLGHLDDTGTFIEEPTDSTAPINPLP